MARFKDPFAQDPPRPTATQRASSFQYQHHGQSVQTKSSGFGNPLSARYDTPVLVHSTRRVSDSGEERFPSLNVPRKANPSQRKIRGFQGSSGGSVDSVPGEQSSNSDLYPFTGSSTFHTSSDPISNSPKKAKGSPGPKAHIMPLLRRISRDGSPSTSLDLSRSSFDNDGLGIYTNYEREGRPNDQFAGYNYTSRKSMSAVHHRSTSGTSQFSTGSGSSRGKPGSQYVHPMRQAPRAYTPPLGQSYPASIFESDDSGKGDAADSDAMAQSNSDAFYSSVRAASGQTPRLSLQIQDGSFTRLPGTSQTNITGRSSFGHSRDNGSALDTASPISRPSLDFVFRSKTRTSMDPVSRAATVQAARQAFEEKEAAKARKFEEQQMKAEQKQHKRKERQHWRTSLRDDEAQEPSTWEKESQEPTPEIHPPRTTPTPQPIEPKPETWRSQPKNTWMHFLTWLRTRIFKLRRRIKNLG
ncbi:hypothetical protein BDV59DRAFT_167607 [Aspergillus ambiguus]|uniref:uncharacterized protein n=1 Tax=Aspergillus ambiguus TaxID=176160 RepID=UPI003CCCAE54